jgi:restriction endonuclease S subunit
MFNSSMDGGLAHLSLTNLVKFEIPVPSLEIQEEIINKINKLNEQSSHYDQYAKFIQTELDNITETIQNMTKSNLN